MLDIKVGFNAIIKYTKYQCIFSVKVQTNIDNNKDGDNRPSDKHENNQQPNFYG